MNIDVEGLDYDVLRSNDWAKYAPKVIVVEAHDFELSNMQNHQTYKFLTNKGYSLKHKVKFSLIFVKTKKD